MLEANLKANANHNQSPNQLSIVYTYSMAPGCSGDGPSSSDHISTPVRDAESSITPVTRRQFAKRTLGPPGRSTEPSSSDSGSTPVQDSDSSMSSGTRESGCGPVEPPRKSTRVRKQVYNPKDWLIQETGVGPSSQPQQRPSQATQDLICKKYMHKRPAVQVESTTDDSSGTSDPDSVSSSSKSEYRRRLDAGYAVDKILNKRTTSDGKMKYLCSLKRAVVDDCCENGGMEENASFAKRHRDEGEARFETTTGSSGENTIKSEQEALKSQFDRFMSQFESSNKKKEDALNEAQRSRDGALLIAKETHEKLKNVEAEKLELQEKLATSESGRVAAETERDNYSKELRRGADIDKRQLEAKVRQHVQQLESERAMRELESDRARDAEARAEDYRRQRDKAEDERLKLKEDLNREIKMLKDRLREMLESIG